MAKEKQEKKKEERFNFAELALVEDELHELEAQQGLTKEKWWQKLGDWYFNWKETRPRHQVNRRVYLWLTVLGGWCGLHRFYEHRWYLGAFYLALCWTGFPVALMVVDWMIAFPMKADEEGKIWI